MASAPEPWSAPRAALTVDSDAPKHEARQGVEPTPFRWKLPLALYLATCASTFFVSAATSGLADADESADLSTLTGTLAALPEALRAGFNHGWIYAAGLMTVLTAHEFGHYFLARRNGVPASLPYFVPLPLPPFGTMGAIIAMRSGAAKTKALFDLSIAGPLAGLFPALIFSYVGLRLSTVEAFDEGGGSLGIPIVFRMMASLAVEPPAEGYGIVLHPLAYAGWVGIFITALNLLPIGQLDGGHILYTLLPSKAYTVSVGVISIAVTAIMIDAFLGWSLGFWPWSFMTMILILLGLKHPPAADAKVPLDRGRQTLGWLTLLFVIVGFTPRPFPY